MKTRFFVIVYATANLGLVLYGVLALLMPSLLLGPLSLRVDQLPADATRAAAYLAALVRLVGFFNILLGLLGLLLLRRLKLSWQSWVVRVVIVFTTLAYLGPIVFDNTVGRIGFMEIVEHLLFALMIVLGILMWSDQAAPNDLLNRLAATRLGVWAVKHVVSPLQRAIYRGTGGRVFSTAGAGRNVLLLTVTGRRTGRDHTTPIFYLREGESVVICNVNPAHERTNPWVINLRANPVARLQMGRETGVYRAREATPAEVERFWQRFVALWHAYQVHYERGGHRVLFILERV
jgi:deazaflavin-dependent oxidoreductase (nitroreductase family)